MPDAAAVTDFLARVFPQCRCRITALGERGATVRQSVSEADLRPGGTVSGTTLMGVADVALYVAILGEIGLEALTVTTSFTMNFLRKPTAERDLIGVCRLMKLGRTLVVGEVSVYSEGTAEAVAHAVGTYSIPPRR